MHIYEIPQANGGLRLLALTDDWYRTVRDDPAMIDCARSEACYDIDDAGNGRWSRPHGCEPTVRGRRCIEARISRTEY